MIFGIVGTLCSGKTTLVKLLEEEFGFIILNLQELFFAELRKVKRKEKCISEEENKKKEETADCSADEEEECKDPLKEDFELFFSGRIKIKENSNVY